MACSQPHVYTAAFILPVLKACALDSYIAAVYKRSILLSEDTKIPVSPEDALMLMNKNMDVLEGAIRTAALQVLSLAILYLDVFRGRLFVFACLLRVHVSLCLLKMVFTAGSSQRKQFTPILKTSQIHR